MSKSIWTVLGILVLLLVGAYFAYGATGGQPPTKEQPIDTTPPQSQTPQQSNALNIRACPDTLIVNQMPQVLQPGEVETSRSYYIWKGITYRIEQFDAAWVKANCNVQAENVY